MTSVISESNTAVFTNLNKTNSSDKPLINKAEATSKTDKVSITWEGRSAAENAMHADLQQYAMDVPSWTHQYSLQGRMLSGHDVNKITDLNKMYDKFGEDGFMSLKEQKAIKAYEQTTMLSQSEQRSAFNVLTNNPKEVDAYEKKIDFHMTEARKELGISNKYLKGSELEEAGMDNVLHQAFKTSIMKDPSTLELMDSLGVKRPKL